MIAVVAHPQIRRRPQPNLLGESLQPPPLPGAPGTIEQHLGGWRGQRRKSLDEIEVSEKRRHPLVWIERASASRPAHFGAVPASHHVQSGNADRNVEAGSGIHVSDFARPV